MSKQKETIEMSDMQKFDISDYIREKVRRVIIGSIPDEQIDAMINSEIKSFFDDRHEYGRTIPSRFSVAIGEKIQEVMKEKIAKWFNDNLESVWDEGVEKMIGPMVVELVPIVQKEMAAQVTSSALASLRMHIDNIGR